MKFFSRPLIPDPKNENRRLIIFAFILIANLLIIGCLLVVWNANAVSDENTTYAILIVGAVSGLFFLCCMSLLLLFFASTNNNVRAVGKIQTVYPTPEFQYFTSTMLNQQKNDRITLQPFQGSAFSVISTQPAASVSTITVSPPFNPDCSYESFGKPTYDRNSGEYMRVF